MTPTEHEGTVAVDAATRAWWAIQQQGARDMGLNAHQLPDFDALDTMRQLAIRESILPVVWAALEALPDRRQAVLDVLAAQDPEPDTWVDAAEGGVLAVWCRREECKLTNNQGGKYTYDSYEADDDAIEALIYGGPHTKPTPASCAAAIAAHAATHTEEPDPIQPLPHVHPHDPRHT